MNKYDTFEDFYYALIFHRNDVTLPDSRTISKERWVTSNGFDVKGFTDRLLQIYNSDFKK